MKYWIITAAFFVISCGGSLSDEQRKKIKEEMASSEIRKVTEVEITEAAFVSGRKVMQSIESFRGDSTKIDSLLKAENGKVKWIVSGTSNAVDLEQQLIDAYIAAETGSLQDNIQKIRNTKGESDSLLYTKPVLRKQANGTEKLEGVWNIWLSKKKLILSMDKR